eukprot:2164053-Amphidinium_carterae.1
MLPQQLFVGRDPAQKWIVASGMYLEGTMPNTVSRMTVRVYILSFGHGLRGLLPGMPGTAQLL